MLLRINEDNYSLELGYDFKFTEHSYLELLSNVLNCFSDEDEMTLFGYTEYDKNLSECKEEMASGYLDEFHRHGYCNHYDRIIATIKEILYKHNSDVSNSKKINKSREELLAEYRNTPLENIDPISKNKVKEFLYSRFFITKLTDFDEEFQEFVKPRISFISKEWDFPPEYSLHFEQPNDFIRTLWINLKGTLEVVKWLNEDSWFICVILEKDKPLSEYNYYLTYKEMEPEPTMVLEIVERRKGHFMDTVLPRLQKIFNNQIEIVD